MKKPLAFFLVLALALALGCSQSGSVDVANATSNEAANAGDKMSDWVVPSQTPGADDTVVGEVIQGEIPGQNADNDLAAIPPARPTMEQLIEPVQKLFNESRFDEAIEAAQKVRKQLPDCLLYTSPSPRDATLSRMPSSA